MCSQSCSKLSSLRLGSPPMRDPCASKTMQKTEWWERNKSLLTKKFKRRRIINNKICPSPSKMISLLQKYLPVSRSGTKSINNWHLSLTSSSSSKTNSRLIILCQKIRVMLNLATMLLVILVKDKVKSHPRMTRLSTIWRSQSMSLPEKIMKLVLVCHNLSQRRKMMASMSRLMMPNFLMIKWVVKRMTRWKKISKMGKIFCLQTRVKNTFKTSILTNIMNLTRTYLAAIVRLKLICTRKNLNSSLQSMNPWTKMGLKKNRLRRKRN